ATPFLDGADDPGHLHDRVLFLHRIRGSLRAPRGLGLAESRDLELYHAGLGPDDVEVRAVGRHRIIRVHDVREKWARTDAFAAVCRRLPRPHRGAGNLSDHGGKNHISLEPDAASAERLAGDHEGRNPALHVRDAEALDLVADDAALEVGFRL